LDILMLPAIGIAQLNEKLTNYVTEEL
jgi:hypothetical protein